MSLRFRERVNEREVVFGEPWREAVAASTAHNEHLAIITSRRSETVGLELKRSFEQQAPAKRSAIVLPLARQHVPEEVVRAARGELAPIFPDCLVCFGGGSAVGLGKAVKRELGGKAKLIVVPTTFAGSEMTDIYGIRRGDHKDVGHDPLCRPDVVVYDPALVQGLPLSIAAPSLLNAMAHAVDALYPGGLTEELESTASEAIERIAAALAAMAEKPDDLENRAGALFGAYRAATVLGAAKMSLHHKLAHVVAGSLDLSHASVHAALLPHVIAFFAGASAEVDETLVAALGSHDPAAHLFDLAVSVGVEMTGMNLGLSRADVPLCAERVAGASVESPRPALVTEMISLLDDVRLGRRPGVLRRLDSPAAGSPPHGGLRPLLVGPEPGAARAALILVHGSGSSAEHIAQAMKPAFDGYGDSLLVVAPQADECRWSSEPLAGAATESDPGFASALGVLGALARRLVARGIPRERIVIAGVTQSPIAMARAHLAGLSARVLELNSEGEEHVATSEQLDSLRAVLRDVLS